MNLLRDSKPASPPAPQLKRIQVFASPSAAAAVIVGRTANGRSEYARRRRDIRRHFLARRKSDYVR